MGGGCNQRFNCMRLLFLGNTYALKAPPPFAWPSNLVTITEATSTLSLNALA